MEIFFLHFNNLFLYFDFFLIFFSFDFCIYIFRVHTYMYLIFLFSEIQSLMCVNVRVWMAGKYRGIAGWMDHIMYTCVPASDSYIITHGICVRYAKTSSLTWEEHMLIIRRKCLILFHFVQFSSSSSAPFTRFHFSLEIYLFLHISYFVILRNFNLILVYLELES